MEISTPMYIGRAASQRGGRPVIRAKISSPTALLSTSNAQVHNASAIEGRSPIEIRHVSSGSASDSNNDSDSGSGSGSVHSYETDATSVDNSPISPEPEPNHLSAYFKPAIDTHSRATSHSSSARPSFDAPRIPQRAPSHSKRAHEGVHRKRSIQRMLSPPPSRGAQDTRSSTEIFGLPSPAKASFVEAPKESSPFANELAQLDEVAEELGQVVKSAERDADAVYLQDRGLGCYSANDYMWEIQGLIHEMFRDEEPKFDFGFF